MHQHGHSQPHPLWWPKFREFWCQDGTGGWAAELALYRGSQSTLNRFSGTKRGMDRIRSLHGLTKLPLLSFKHISMLLAAWRFWHWAGREGWPPLCNQSPKDGGLCPGKGSINVVGTPDTFLSWGWEQCSWGKLQHPGNDPSCRACPEVAGA